ncbi:hypothetical protein F2P81_019197 [Scophthalmus maximus]|uniref:Suppressor of tumorigenicity 14 protein-like n=1 Tax=Scophthalmus maximus TaxID=52904 RepID=A0A6A4S935_SCOMX|nr:hypothetical protein F2P81_019197 [Scophthalmus maximus]
MGTECDENEPASGDDDASQKDVASIADVSVEVATVDHTLQKLCMKYRQTRRKPRGLKKLLARLLNIPHIAVIIAAVVFVVVVIMWSLLWVFIFRRESNSGAYFAGMFRLVNVEFIPEYRHAESSEFVSMANKIQHVVSNVYKMSSMARLYKLAVISDLSNSKGGVLVHFWMVFVVPRLKSPAASVQRSDYTSTAAGSQCVDKMYASLPGARIPLNVFSSWGGVSCHVKLTAVPGSLIRLTITSLLIEPSACVNDALTVYDALLPMRGRILHRLCEPVSTSFSLVSTSNVMLLSFRMTNGNKSFRGHFEAIAEETCYTALLQLRCVTFSADLWCTTSNSALGVALQFHNYVLKPKDMKGCDHGWWRVNEIIFCGSYVGHGTVFRIADCSPEVEFRCSSRSSAQPFRASYSSYNISQPCPESHFLCSTGLCVDKSRRCDGLDDCQDESDEVFCSRPTMNCGGNSPLHPLFVCNGEADCTDGSDEINCTQVIAKYSLFLSETTCSAIRYKCSSGSCIMKKNAKCDGVHDCQDHSDEADCGPERIVGGVNSVEGEWPWQVSLHFSGNLYCGASVLSSTWLISAAHCFSKERLSDPRHWSAHLGMLTQGSAKHVAEIQRIVVHEYYNAYTFDYDIALLQLKKPWPSSLGPLVQPVCLPPTSHSVTDSHRCWVTGWGYRSEEAIALTLHYLTSPPSSVFFLGGSVEFPNLSFSSELTDSTSPQFGLQAQALNHYLSDLYESSPWSSYYLRSGITAFSEGVEGLNVFYWSKFSAPDNVAMAIQRSCPERLQRRLPGNNKVQRESFNEQRYYMERDDDMLHLLGLDPDDFEAEEKSSGKIKNPNSIQSGKWQLGFQAMSFDLYAKYGYNRTLSLVSPKKPYYQWRLRVPSGHVVRLVVLTLHGATPGSCTAHKLSAYDFLLPLQNKIIASRQRDGAIFKAYFQAIPKAGCGGSLSSWNGSISSPYYPSYYPPSIDCTWTLRAPLPGYLISMTIVTMDIQDSPSSDGCEKDWLDIGGVKLCRPVSDSSKKRVYSSPLSLHFHSDESLTHKGFYLLYRAFSPESTCPRQFRCGNGRCIPLRKVCDGVKDCSDGRDEAKCSSCRPGDVMCGNGQCKPQSSQCVSQSTCPDSSEERDCGSKCYHVCPNKVCLPKSSVCDGVTDCKDRSDELNCTRAYFKGCSSSSYKCANGKCVGKINPECDGVKDCFDGSDELRCGCGTRPRKRAKIVGGSDAGAGSWPWQVSLQMDRYGHVCGATLVSSRWLISAAHCFQDSDAIK